MLTRWRAGYVYKTNDGTHFVFSGTVVDVGDQGYAYECRSLPKELNLKTPGTVCWRQGCFDRAVEEVGKLEDLMKEKEKDTVTNKLYEVKQGETTTYATYLATNSEGQWVMEPKGGGNPFATDKDQCIEVIPHTISVLTLHSRGGPVHLTAEKGKYNKGEVYILQNNMLCVVLGTDTKEKTNNEFKPVARVLTEKL